jgi:hypothetical protein
MFPCSLFSYGYIPAKEKIDDDVELCPDSEQSSNWESK